MRPMLRGLGKLTMAAMLAAGAGRAAGQDGMDGWFAWTARSDTGPSVIGAQSLLDAPAGRHGRVRAEGDSLMYNGQRFKIWGMVIGATECSYDRAGADHLAAFAAKYGLNGMRLHKFADGPGILSAGSGVVYDEERVRRMDYLVHALKEKGIYVLLSANLGNVRFGPDDRPGVPDAEAMGTPMEEGWTATHAAAVWLAPAIQDLQINQMCNILKRTNVHTGLAYAEDPAVMAVELLNENNAFWYSIWGGCRASPALKALAGQKFAAWLREKYGTEGALLAAWGPGGGYDAISGQDAEGESWDGMIYPAGGPWWWDNIDGSQAHVRVRLVDAALFWYDQQCQFHDRFVDAIRDTGYGGEILASNWLAGEGFAHYLNLYSDRRIGLIDRHNYHEPPGSMLATPGSGILSAGMNQQAVDRPFMLSEWIHDMYNQIGMDWYGPGATWWDGQSHERMLPERKGQVLWSDWVSEGPPLVAAYGMGLNGWDASFALGTTNGFRFRDFLPVGPWQQWNLISPQFMGVMPAVSRMALRGDVAESAPLFTRHVDMASVRRGELGFKDTATANHDVKTYDSDTLSSRLMAVGRMVVEFGDEPRSTEKADPGDYMRDGMLVSSTGELRWRPGAHGHDGHVTIDTPRTQAVVGFAEGRETVLADTTLTVRTPFASLYVTSLDDNTGVGEADRLLLTAIARARNTGMHITERHTVEAAGLGPVLMEPVRATLVFKRGEPRAVHILDHDGRRTGQTLPAPGGVLDLDTAEAKTIYFEVEY